MSLPLKPYTCDSNNSDFDTAGLNGGDPVPWCMEAARYLFK